jgi:cobalt-precorrin 5A hydrolase
VTVWLVAYSSRGCETALRAAAALEKRGNSCRVFASEKHRVSEAVEALSGPCADWARRGFAEADALIFCCAAGIAVRGIAPHVRSKKTDPAVLVVDETARFVISLLSGHIGGANELASDLAADLGAQPVITTATDLNGLFAVDVFAEKNHLYIESMALAKEVSAALLAGEPVGFCSDLPVRGNIPPELTADLAKASLGVCVTADVSKAPWPRTLRLVPRRCVAGLGCRRGKDAGEMARFFAEKLAESGVNPHALRSLASVDLKADEPCLLALAEQYRLPFVTYSADELGALPGEFSGSAFVKGVTGVDCVSERAALLAAGEGGRLIWKKTAGEGMTFALAESKEEICFG